MRKTTASDSCCTVRKFNSVGGGEEHYRMEMKSMALWECSGKSKKWQQKGQNETRLKLFT